uniref:Uncharacterized protein n=1 Tax=Anguilla anguilla TaxID=7936 RepID=A0A0E9XTA2_ANGAN
MHVCTVSLFSALVLLDSRTEPFPQLCASLWCSPVLHSASSSDQSCSAAF